MVAVENTLKGLLTTGTKVDRDRVYDVDVSTGAALSVYMGIDTPDELSNMSLLDSTLEFQVVSHVKVNSINYTSTTLNKIRKEVHFAFMANQTLGLSFASDLTPGIADAPIYDRGENPTAKQTLNWSIRYRHSYTDPSA